MKIRHAPVLMYHRLTARSGLHPVSLSAERFGQQLGLLRRLGYRSVSPVTVADALRGGPSPGRRAIAITFDDGYLDTLTVGLPLLVEHGFTATCYVVAGAIGRTSEWTEPAPLMGWSGMRDWLAAGMEIGAHSVTHSDLTRLDDRRLAEEVTGARRRLEDRLGIPIASFAYPYNIHDDRTDAAVAAAGFRAGCAGVHRSGSPMALFRADAARDSWTRFALQLTPAYPVLRAVYRAAVPAQTNGEYPLLVNTPQGL
jgi:peptidoglycan/xylan/chitin deacetylase (PgdA/CDA1 family)